MTRLTVERLFGETPLTGTVPTRIKFAPDGSYLCYLRSADDDRERQDLWRYDIATGERRCWVDARQLAEAAGTLTDAEKAERERKRQFATGITDYSFSRDGNQVLIPAAGAAYLLDVASGACRVVTPPGTRQTDMTLSPSGRYLSYVRSGNLYVLDLEAQEEQAVTSDGGGTVSYGIADFIAQEEMHRFEGHWWAGDDSAIAFTRVDESTVAVSQRYEIDAEQINVIEQRYPYAGERNASVALFVCDLNEGTTTEISYGATADGYLARVGWAGAELAVQTQTRDQQALTLQFLDPKRGTRRAGLEEKSPTWINLTDNFRSLDGNRFLWTSERDGHSHLYLYSNGEPHQLTTGAGHVDSIVHVDEERVLVSGWFETPTEQHVYAVPLAGGNPERVTGDPGWHEVSVAPDGLSAVDRSSSLEDPGSLKLLDLAAGTGAPLLAEDDATHPYTPYLPEHCTAELGTLEAEDGQPLHYRLTRPRDASADAPVPLVVHVYGGPGVQRVKNEWAPLTLQLFAQRGFGVLELDNRGSSNRGRRFEAPIYKRLGEAEVSDQLVGARFAQALDWVDAARIGVFGHSYGGFMTLMCLAKAPELFQAGVSVAPVTDWRLYDTHYTERYLATPGDNEEGYTASSVFPFLDGIRGKLLIMHGMADDNVLFTNSTKLFKALQSRNIAFEMMTYPGSKHALQERDVSIHRFTLILDFFDRTLGRGAAP